LRPDADLGLVVDGSGAAIPVLGVFLMNTIRTTLATALVVLAIVAPAQAQQRTGTIVFTNPEALALRKQYNDWGRDNRMLWDTWTAVVHKDLYRAAEIILYNKECGPINEDRLHHANLLFEAFPDASLDHHKYAAKSLEVQGHDRWCRAINPTPIPPVP